MNVRIAFYIFVIVMNLLSFLLYGIDKSKAKRHKWRISEKTLILSAFFFGGPGAMAGMSLFRHKTKHIKFLVCVPLAVIINIICCVFILGYISPVQ